MRGLILPALILLAAGASSFALIQTTPIQPIPADLSASVRASGVFSLSNAERKDAGVAQLSLNPLLMRAAQLKAEDMAEEAYYAHVSPDGETPMHWLNAVGYQYLYVGENLTANIMHEDDVVSAWMGSPGHKRNLLDPKFTHMGIGVAEGTYKGKDALFVVQMLATPKPVVIPPAPRPVAVTPKPVAPIKPPPAKPIATPKPAAPKTISESEIVKDVVELTKPIVDPLVSTSTERLFTATGTDPLPLVISTTAIPVELRSTGSTLQLPEQSEMREAGRRTSLRWFDQLSELASRIRVFIGL